MHRNLANLEQGKRKHIHIKTLEIKKTLSWTHGAKAQMDVRVRVYLIIVPLPRRPPDTPEISDIEALSPHPFLQRDQW